MFSRSGWAGAGLAAYGPVTLIVEGVVGNIVLPDVIPNLL